MEDAHNRLIIALDYPDLAPALDVARLLLRQVTMFKVGLELFNVAGPAAVTSLRDLGAGVFYDSKFHDIPNTVAGAAAAAARLGVSMFNVHTLGGRTMMAAAKEAALGAAEEAGFTRPLVIGVTVVTSLGDDELQHELGIPAPAREAVLRLALQAKEAGLDGVVASAHEVADIKRLCGKDFLTVTPGIRPAGADRGDQARVATPGEAVRAGADYLVVGRPVTRADDPRAATAAILREMAE